MQKLQPLQPNLHFLFSHVAHFFALGFGSGLAKKAPGTFGTMAAVPCWFLLDELPLVFLFVAISIAFAIGVWFCERTSRDLGVHDHGGIVWDEFVGLWLTYAFASGSYTSLALGFVLFRIFDIAKPWPIRWLDRRVHGGFGIMIDDVVAGLLAGIALWAIQLFVIAI